jgi:hypothetical protein
MIESIFLRRDESIGLVLSEGNVFESPGVIMRPGINELNPTIDFGDSYNIRFGNEKLLASTAPNFDLVLDRTKQLYYINLGLGYNIVEHIFSQDGH